ncbi:hypothetical protein KI387_026153 [Taxus chinensis]|uniref:Enhancer of polycomb-like protein n=1 Tax=Taxus chinensis TaxID=29808 RepID=A0AA38KYA0_TAXCH|nr:hypothetical protein KI387_026153 [Taxus chinensis]
MSSEPVEPQGEDTPQQKQLENNPGSRHSRYELRTPRNNQVGINVSKKRKAADNVLPKRADKRRKVGADPCDQKLSLDATGGVSEKLKGADPCDQRLPSDADGLCEVRINESDFFSVINRRIAVYWPLEGTWYVGNIKRYDAYNKLHHVVYDDGEEEWVSLDREKYRIQVVPGEALRLPSYGRKRNVHGSAEKRGSVQRKRGSGGADIVQKRSGVGVGNVSNVVQRISTDVIQNDAIDNGANVVHKNGITGDTDVLQRSSIGGYTDIVQRSCDGGLQKGYVPRRRRLKMDYKQVKNAGIGDLEKDNGDGISGDTDTLQRSGVGGDIDIVLRSGNGGLQKGYISRKRTLKRDYKQFKNVGIGDLEKDNGDGIVVLDSANKRPGKVKQYDPTNKLQLVGYENGEEEWVPLDSHNFKVNVPSRYIAGVPSSSLKSIECESAEERGIGRSKHGGTEILERSENSGLQKTDNGRWKRCKRDSKQATNDVQKNYDVGVAVNYTSALEDPVFEHKTESIVEKVRVARVSGDSGNASGAEKVKSAGIEDLQKDCVDVGVDSAKVWLDFTEEHKQKSKSEKLGLAGHSDIYSDLKQVKNAGIDDWRRDHDRSVGVDSGIVLLRSVPEHNIQSKVEQNRFASDFDDFGINCGAEERAVNTPEDQVGSTSMPHNRKLPAITYSRKQHRHSKRGHSFIQDRFGKGGNGVPISSRTEAKAKGKCVEDEIGIFSGLDNDSGVQKHPFDKIGASSGRSNDSVLQKHFNDKVGTSSGLTNDSVVQKQPLNAYFRKRKRSQPDHVRTVAQMKGSCMSIQSFEQSFLFSPKKLIVSGALKIHVSPPLYLRQPSYCQCVDPGLQLFYGGSGRAYFQLVKSQSLEDLKYLLQSMLQFYCAGVQQSSSSHPALQQFGAGIVNPSNLKYLSLWQLLVSDIEMQVLIVDTISNVRRFYVSGSFWEVLSNFITSLVPVMCTGAPESANLHMAFQSITVQISSPGHLPFTCKFDNIHWTPSAKQAEWWLSLKHKRESRKLCSPSRKLHSPSRKLIKGESSRGSSANHVGSPFLPRKSIFTYKQDEDIINGLQESSETRCFTYHHQHRSRVPLHSTRSDFGTYQTIPSFQVSFTSAPSFFSCLHMMLYLGKGICFYGSQSPELLSSNEGNDPNSIHAETGIVECNNKHFLPGVLFNTEKPAIFSRASESSIIVPSNVLQWSIEKPVKLEENIFAVPEDWRVQSSAPSLGFEFNVTRRFSDMQVKRDNLLPVLKIRRTNNNSWHFAGVSNPSSIEVGTSRVMFPRVVGTDGHMESSQSAGSRTTSENFDDVVLRSARSGRRGRPRRQSNLEKLKEMGAGFSKLRSDLDSAVCTTNILVFGRDGCWREPGAEVRLVHKPNEWVLDVKLHGSTKITYKAQEQKIRKSQEKKQRVPSKPNCYTITWTGGQNWSLEFPDRIQWCLFRDMYQECYNRNFRAASVKDHPTPAVRLLSKENSSTVDVPFERPLNYIKATEDELTWTMSRSNIYDMDSDDEEWLCQFNSRATHEGDSVCDKVSEDIYERVISSLEKAAFFQPHSLTIEDAIQACPELVPEEELASIYSHWLEKREKKKDLYWYGSRGSVGIKALIPQFEMKGKESLPQSKRRGKIFRGKSFTGQHSVRSIGKHHVRNQEIEIQHKLWKQQQVNRVSFDNGCSSHAFELQQQQQDNRVSFGNGYSSRALELWQQHGINGVSFGNRFSSHAIELQQQRVNGMPSGIESSSRALVLVSDEEVRVQEAKIAARNAEEFAAAKRARSRRLLQKVDLATFKAVKAFRIAETKETSKEARLSNIAGSIFSPNFSTDSRADENGYTREGSIGSPSWAVSTYRNALL